MIPLEPLPSGNDPEYIGRIGSWNSGVFFFNWIWALVNINIGFGLLFLLCQCIPVVNIIAFIYLIVKGNDLSWKYRHYNSIAEFREIQGAWTKAGVIFWVISFLLGIMIGIANS